MNKPVISDYERLREENISRNKAFLDSLGLDDAKPIAPSKRGRRSGIRRRGRGGNSDDEDDDFEEEDDEDPEDESNEEDDDGTREAKRSRRASKAARAEKRFAKTSNKANRPEQQPTRRSSRTAGVPAELRQLDADGYSDNRSVRQSKPLPSFSMEINVDSEELGRKKVTAKSLREHMDSSSEASATHSAVISDEAVVHCAYRISSMSNKALATRVKMIARAHGKSSHEKLLVFYYGLQAAGLEELAASCYQACKHSGALELVKSEGDGDGGKDDGGGEDD
jgi:hypothetical protein